MVNILLIGNGAREHVLAETLLKNSSVNLFAYMKTKNPGIAKLAARFELNNLDNLEAIKKFATDNAVEFAVIGPEAPLEAGVVDALEEVGIKSVGPKKKLARLETSKAFTRDIMLKYNIEGNPKFKVFMSMNGIKEFMEELGCQFVVKADVLMGGKGVKVVGEHLDGIDDGLAYCKECVDSHGIVVVEEKLIGEEFSLQCIADGEHVVATPVAQDHKRAYVGDTGPNTGGMGSYSDSSHLLPFLKQEHVEKAEEITHKLCNALKQEVGYGYKGIMYGGFMLTKDGVKVIEYNARFGDPEAMNVLPLLKTDLVDVCKRVIDGTLNHIKLEFENKATVCKYAVPEGYPENPVKGEKIDLGDVREDVKVYYASVDKKEDGLYMTGSRAIAFVGIADSLPEAERIAEEGVKAVKGKVFHREDIGTKELIEQRVKHMKDINFQ